MYTRVSLRSVVVVDVPITSYRTQAPSPVTYFEAPLFPLSLLPQVLSSPSPRLVCLCGLPLAALRCPLAHGCCVLGHGDGTV